MWPTAPAPAGPSGSALQRLWDLGQEALQGPGIPTDAQIAELQRAMSASAYRRRPPARRRRAPRSTIYSHNRSSPLATSAGAVPLAELGLEAAARAAAAKAAVRAAASAPPPPASGGAVTYLHILEAGRISLGVFLLPAGTVLPLHSHPGMTVLSRVLFGALRVRAYDWAEPAAARGTAAHRLQSAAGWARRAKLHRAGELQAGDAPAALFPESGGNLHELAALEDCAVLDLLSPPYAPDEGRDCGYYEVLAGADGEPRLRELRPAPEPSTRNAPYAGVVPVPRPAGWAEGTPSALGDGGSSSAGGSYSAVADADDSESSELARRISVELGGPPLPRIL
jgi:hypothetical protein